MSWRRYFRRKQWDRERAREIESYLEIETYENIARGMTPADAASAARRKFGNPMLVREEIYHMNTFGWIESIWQDLRHGVRLLRMSPGFTVVAVTSLALGIGANTAIFQLLDAVRLRSLPVKNPSELAEVKIAGGNHGMGLNQRYGELTRPIWKQVEHSQTAFNGMFAWSLQQWVVGQGGGMEQINGLNVSAGFFNVLGVQPWRGRLFASEDEHACPASAAVISYQYWQSKMGGREFKPGDKVLIDGGPTEIIGVTPPSFSGLAVGEHFDIALPMCSSGEPRRDLFDVSVIGRLRPGWTTERASAQLASLSPGIMEATELMGYSPESIRDYRRFRLSAYPASAGVSNLRDQYDSSLRLLLAITGLVLLIACANLANLMLARGSVREHEIAIRMALGGSRRRVLRQLLAESALLAFAGAGAGIGLAQALSRILVRSLSTEGGQIDLRIETDWRVLLFAGAVAILTCLFFGIAPALRATKTDPVSAMKSSSRSTTGTRERFSLQRAMVVTQISVSTVLLVGALLFVRSFHNLMTFNPGIREEGVVLGFVGFSFSNVPPARFHEFKRELSELVRSTPGVLQAATTTVVPLTGGSWGHTIHVGAIVGGSKFTGVSPEYFEVMGIPLLFGRAFGTQDTNSSQRVAVVNETFVRRFLVGADPIGKSMRTNPEPNYPSTVYQIVGVIKDTKYDSLRSEIPPMAFVPEAQYPALGPWTSIVIHSSESPDALIASVKRRLVEAHPELVLDFFVFKRMIQDGLVRERMMATLSGFFGLLAALLAMVGLYGVISYLVARRRNEIGIRVALGARRGQVIGMVLREAVILVAIGLAAGSALALAAGRGADSLLFGLKSHDPAILLAGAALLAAIALLASFLPAYRASRLDPMDALRSE